MVYTSDCPHSEQIDVPVKFSLSSGSYILKICDRVIEFYLLFSFIILKLSWVMIFEVFEVKTKPLPKEISLECVAKRLLVLPGLWASLNLN